MHIFINSFTKKLASMTFAGIVLIWTISIAIAFMALPMDSSSAAEQEQICSIQNQIRAIEYGKTAPFPDSTLHHLDWFVQISDIHISADRNRKIGPDLLKFCNEIIRVIKPKVTIASGDLTDAKPPYPINSRQSEVEWKEYSDIIKQSGVTNHTIWLDIRGNHDTFNVPSWNSTQNYYRSYGIQGAKGRVYGHTYSNSDGDNYTFIAVDTSPEPGPKRPFNFFGIFTEEMMLELKNIAVFSCYSNMTIWFGHYPTSVIGRASSAIRKIISNGAVYMCGHFHKAKGFVSRMYARHLNGNLELEVSDWQNARRYRIFAMDHGLFSFIDTEFASWPVILVTNPKNAEFAMPKYEPLRKMINSTHIRILVFSTHPITNVQVWLDGVSAGNAQHSDGPLYVLEWQTHHFMHSTHNIQVQAQDSAGHESTVRHLFCLGDCPVVNSPLLGRLLLMPDFNPILKIFFFLVWSIILLSLIAVKIFKKKLQEAADFNATGWLGQWLQTWLCRFYLLGSASHIIHIMIAFTIYIAVGPWFIGELTHGHIGVCFVFGQMFRTAFIPGSITYLHGVLQLVTFNVPLALYLAYCLDEHHRHINSRLAPKWRVCTTWLHQHWVFLLITVWQSYLAVYGTYMSYGYAAFFLCPIRTWSVPMAIYLRYKALLQNSITAVSVSSRFRSRTRPSQD